MRPFALMHRELVDERQWVGEGSFLRALNLCHLLPGPEAQQLATWIGWRLFVLKRGMIVMLGVCAALGVVLSLV